jgi:hypothetical protein
LRTRWQGAVLVLVLVLARVLVLVLVSAPELMMHQYEASTLDGNVLQLHCGCWGKVPVQQLTH